MRFNLHLVVSVPVVKGRSPRIFSESTVGGTLGKKYTKEDVTNALYDVTATRLRFPVYSYRGVLYILKWLDLN